MLGLVLRRRHLVVAAALLLPAPALSGTIGLRWDSVSGATGYRVYFGTAAGQYTASTDVGAATETTVANLADCTTWYLAVKAYNAAGESPSFSNEVSGWPAPRVDSLSTAVALQGDSLTVTVRGANFQPGSSIEFVPPSGETIWCGSPSAPAPNPSLGNLRADSVSVTDCNRIQTLVSATGSIGGEHAAEVGRWDAIVLGPADGAGQHVYGWKPQAFEVRIDPLRFDVNTGDWGGGDVPRLTTADTQWLLSGYASFLVNPNTCGRDPRYLEDLDLDGNGMIDGDDVSYIYSSGITDLLETCWNGSGWSTGACPAR